MTILIVVLIEYQKRTQQYLVGLSTSIMINFYNMYLSAGLSSSKSY